MPMFRASQPPPVSPSRSVVGAPFTSHYHDALALASASASTQSVSDSSVHASANELHSSYSQRGASTARAPVASAMRPTNQQLLLQRAQQRSAAAAAAAQAEPSSLSIAGTHCRMDGQLSPRKIRNGFISPHAFSTTHKNARIPARISEMCMLGWQYHLSQPI